MKVVIRYMAGRNEKVFAGRENEDYRLDVQRDGNRTRIVICAKRPLTLISSFIRRPFDYEPDSRIFVNGYQSWTDTREYDLRERLHNMNLVPRQIKAQFHFEAYGDAWFYPYRTGVFHGFTWSYVRTADDRTDLVGSLNEANAFLIIEHHPKTHEMLLKSDCQYRRVTDSFCLYDFVHEKGTAAETSAKYFARYGTCGAKPVRGYTSWYLDYQNITQEKLLRTLDTLDTDAFDLFQIDDGYEPFVGDWMETDREKFPDGLSPVVDRIHEKGLLAGIWLAPFVCETGSRTYQEHPEWIYRENGKEVFAGCNWSGDVVLDIRNEEVRCYLRDCLTHFMDLGFDFFKLDFLYAAALIHEGGGSTRAEMMRSGMQFLRDVLGDRLILGCGVPLGSAFNLVDYCRIGPDVSLKFDDEIYMRPMHRERISTKMTMMNMIYRSVMDGSVFRCDPDVFLLRDERNELTRQQREALLLMGSLCGSVYMTSDDTGSYDAQKKELLEEAVRLRGAAIRNIRKDGRLITVSYILDGQTGRLVYDSAKGILMKGDGYDD